MANRSFSTREAVFREIRSRIINLVYLPGSAISESELAQQLSVSRTPVREALVLLINDGLVEVFPKRGTFITKIDMQTVRETQFIREAVELASLAELQNTEDSANFSDGLHTESKGAAIDLDPSLVSQIKRNLALQKDAADHNDTKKFFALDEEFHEALLALAGHRRAWSVIENSKPHLDRARMLGFQQVNPPSEYYLQHCNIFKSITENNISRAMNLLRAHLRTVFNDSAIAQSALPEFFTNLDENYMPKTISEGAIPIQMLRKESLQALTEMRINQ